MRGEGGILRLKDGTRFMPSHDQRAELAPRDIVARAIDFEMKRHGLDCVFLDMTHKGEEFLREHFPNIHARCKELGIERVTLYRYVGPKGELRDNGKHVLGLT
jgi:L-aspartate oxidase